MNTDNIIYYCRIEGWKSCGSASPQYLCWSTCTCSGHTATGKGKASLTLNQNTFLVLSKTTLLARRLWDNAMMIAIGKSSFRVPDHRAARPYLFSDGQNMYNRAY